MRIGTPCNGLLEVIMSPCSRKGSSDVPSHTAHGAFNVQSPGNIQCIRINFPNGSQGGIDLLYALDVCLVGVLQYEEG